MQLSVLLSALVSVTVFVAASPTPGVTLRSSYKREKLDTKFECDLPEEGKKSNRLEINLMLYADYSAMGTGDGPVIAEGINKKHEELETNFIDYKVGSTKKREELETNFIDYKVGSIGGGDLTYLPIIHLLIIYFVQDKKCEELETNFIDYKVGLSGGGI
ncbi:hypothetical protein EDB19DRAFT_1773832 [Suillus lakei]|nr:hypothetical protein EDB19DRAFT_1773832 [Suillus lakei]